MSHVSSNGRHFYDYSHWFEHLDGSRDGYSRPVAYARRIEWAPVGNYRGPNPHKVAGEPKPDIALRHHSTRVIRYHANGTMTLANGGWATVTTLATLRQYSPARIFSQKGTWYVRVEADPADPMPTVDYVDIPKPFVASDPGEVPAHECKRETEPDHPRWSGYRPYCHTCSNHEWQAREFERYTKNIERYGAQGWADARKEAMRVRRAQLKAYREWDARNRVPFEDGITITSDGYVSRKDYRAMQRAAKALERALAKRQREQARELRKRQREQAQAHKRIAKQVESLRATGRFEHSPETTRALAWCVENNVTVTDDGYAVLCKATNAEGLSNHGARYVVDEETTCDDFAPTEACGAGLHFSPTLEMARRYGPVNGAGFICHVPIVGLIPLHDKCKAPMCKVVAQIA